MRPRTLIYNIGQGFKGVFRNSVMSTASILVLIACMILVGTFYLVLDTIDRNFAKINNLNVVEIMLDKDYDEEQIVEIGKQLSTICNDSSIVDWDSSIWEYSEENPVPKKNKNPKSSNFYYLSADEHLELMREMYKDEKWIQEIFDHAENAGCDEGEHAGIVNSIEDNPLRPSYRVTFVNLSAFDEVTKVKNRIDEITVTNANGEKVDGILTEDIKDNIELYGNVMDVKNALELAGIWLLAIFLLISLFVIMNTIKLGIAARKNEIRFMRLCGATKSFIRMPFFVEGIIIGTFSAAASFGIEFWLYEYLLKDIVVSATGTAAQGGIISAPFMEYAPIVGAGFLVIGLFAGIVASGVSLNKYLDA